MTETINGDLALRICVDTSLAEWAPSPSGNVWRKRVHLVGPSESGQVTSVVRYEPGATFPEHGHPDGEEILVLDGVFSDEHGDWPKGSYLLNPDGFRHAPYSQHGCVIFVKLRQFPGKDRDHVAISTNQLAWTESDQPGIEIQKLYAQPGYTDRTRIERWAKNTSLSRTYRDGAELFVIDGDFADDSGTYRACTWMRMPKSSSHATRTNGGCTLYIKEGGFTYLNSAATGG